MCRVGDGIKCVRHGACCDVIEACAIGHVGVFRTCGTRDTCLLQPQGPLIPSVCPGLSVFAQLHTESSTDWLLTGRVRGGWVYSTGYLYLTGGLAVTQLKAATRYVDNTTPG